MKSRVKTLFKEYSELPENDKWAFALQVLEDLHGPVDPGAEQEWLEEIDRRLTQLDKGPVRTHPWEHLNSKMKQLLDDKKR